MNTAFSNFPTLQTERLLLRSVSEQDAAPIHKLQSDPVVNAFVGRENSSTLESAKAYILRMETLVQKNECMYWVIASKNDSSFIGCVCLWNYDQENEIVEIGYEMLSELQGKGFMTEALNAVIAFTFDTMKAKLITAFPSADNLSSVAILKKLHFVFENEAYNNKHQNIKNLTTYTLRPKDF
ncbi:ribosomal-protein-alanine N-acetyltransferase [Flavobacterium sp. 270]|uniref:GNAT family N-acetyltransferase n=1 Tax=Flavobacterium sp. 270 TaxID=2512114 RepID=UPI0010655483|nr:GNAT family N-acetyltransferase [Flavobacterium sp. 270]TDW46611.1 ribosomal-protein-alanine N-acetyltransferase [Flavobacterium sp. 270]